MQQPGHHAPNHITEGEKNGMDKEIPEQKEARKRM
jgi:hypothetical protein